MPFKMIANRHVYRIDDGKEYKKGESFTVATEKERDRLVRNKRASVDEGKAEVVAPKAAHVAARPELKTRAMTTENTSAPARPSAAPTGGITHTTDNNAPSGEISANKPNRYRRNDMRAED